MERRTSTRRTRSAFPGGGEGPVWALLARFVFGDHRIGLVWLAWMLVAWGLACPRLTRADVRFLVTGMVAFPRNLGPEVPYAVLMVAIPAALPLAPLAFIHW